MHNILFKFLNQYIELTDEEKQAILEFNLLRDYKKGTILLKNGDRSKITYFVLKGCVRSYYVIDGEEKTTDFFTEAESITPLCTVNNEPSEYFLSCVEDCILSVGTRDVEKEFFLKFPRFESICRMVSEQLIVKNQASFAEYRTSTPGQRYLKLMKERSDLIQRVPQYQIASFLGIKPESLSRIRKRMTQNQQ